METYFLTRSARVLEREQKTNEESIVVEARKKTVERTKRQRFDIYRKISDQKKDTYRSGDFWDEDNEADRSPLEMMESEMLQT